MTLLRAVAWHGGKKIALLPSCECPSMTELKFNKNINVMNTGAEKQCRCGQNIRMELCAIVCFVMLWTLLREECTVIISEAMDVIPSFSLCYFCKQNFMVSRQRGNEKQNRKWCAFLHEDKKCFSESQPRTQQVRTEEGTHASPVVSLFLIILWRRYSDIRMFLK